MNDNHVTDFMNHDPIIVTPATIITEIKYLLSKYDLDELVVVDDEKHPVGIVGRSDVETEEIENMEIPSDVSAMECMRKIPTVAMNNTTLEESLNVMRANHIDSLIIIDGNGKLEGTINQAIIKKIIM
jgi:predicted transcriptional regulator